jgi:hypothetical protein
MSKTAQGLHHVLTRTDGGMRDTSSLAREQRRGQMYADVRAIGRRAEGRDGDDLLFLPGLAWPV